MAGAIRRGVARVQRAPDWQLVLAFVAFAALCEGLKLEASYYDFADVASGLAAAAAFLGAGLLARRRQPDNRTGLLLVMVGFALLAEDIQTSPSEFWVTIGVPLGSASAPVLLWLVLAFPSGVLTGRLDRWLVGGMVCYAATEAASLGVVGHGCFEGCSVFYSLGQYPEAQHAVEGVGRVLLVGLVATATLVLLTRWLRSSPAARRVLNPFLLAAALVAAATVTKTVLDDRLASDAAQDFAQVVTAVATVLLPFSFLLGLVRLELARVDVIQGVIGLGSHPALADLRAAASRALGDPLLRVLRREGDEFEDEAGHRVAEPTARAEGIDLVRRGERLGVLMLDPALRQDGRLLDAVTGVLAEALEKGRTAEAERRRIERDLHDGAQQRIAGATLWLGVLESRLRSGDEQGAWEVIARLGEELEAAVDDLRGLTHGMLPPALVEKGLDEALRDLAERTPMPVTVSGSSGPDVPLAIGAAAYFAATEGLTNAIRHSGAHAVEIWTARRNGLLELEVCDDGSGGADMAAGTGLRGLAARMESAGGRLELRNREGGGTVLRAELPLVPAQS